jgi:hypothetical protein
VVDVACERDDHASESIERNAQRIGVVDRAYVQPHCAVVNSADDRCR